MERLGLSDCFPRFSVCDNRYLYYEPAYLARSPGATVYAAVDQMDGNVVALKLLHVRVPAETDEDLAKRLRRFAVETTVYSSVCAAGVDGVDCITPTLGANVTPGTEQPYHVMPFAWYGTARRLINHQFRLGTPLAAGQVLRYAAQAAAGLSAAHACGYVHRDVKPENLLIPEETADGFRMQVADFGIARTAQNPTLQGQQRPLGTLGYMPPEQMEPGLEEITPSSDVWALALTIYELFVLAPYWESVERTDLQRECPRGSTAPACERAARHWSDTSGLSSIEEWLKRGLSPRPAERFEGPRQQVEALRRALESAGTDLSRPLVEGPRSKHRPSKSPSRSTPSTVVDAAIAVPPVGPRVSPSPVASAPLPGTPAPSSLRSSPRILAVALFLVSGASVGFVTAAYTTRKEPSVSEPALEASVHALRPDSGAAPEALDRHAGARARFTDSGIQGDATDPVLPTPGGPVPPTGAHSTDARKPKKTRETRSPDEVFAKEFNSWFFGSKGQPQPMEE